MATDIRVRISKIKGVPRFVFAMKVELGNLSPLLGCVPRSGYILISHAYTHVHIAYIYNLDVFGVYQLTGARSCR